MLFVCLLSISCLHIACLSIIQQGRISMSVGGGFVMKLPLIWWTVGVASHGLTVVIIELVTRYQEQ